MSKPPVERVPGVIDIEPADLIEPLSTDHGGAFSFNYSYTEITATGGKSHVKSRRTRYADGKLSTENFDGEFDRSIYDGALDQMHRAFANQALLLLRTFASMFPTMRRDRD